MWQKASKALDFYPEEMRLRNWLFDNFTYASLLHGFEDMMHQF